MNSPRIIRPAQGRMIAGVCAGLAEHIGQPVIRVRVAFVIASLIQGAGIGIYLGLWIFIPMRDGDGDHVTSSPVRRTQVLQAGALAALVAGVIALIQVSGQGIRPSLFGPLAIAGVGVILVWRQFDNQQSGQGQRASVAVARIIIGTFLVGMAAVYLLSSRFSLTDSVNLLVTVAVALLGMGLVLGPWIVRLIGDLSAERRERIRTQERADVAAHLHDSVLQTLALLQKSADDPAAVSTLARRQERELREWLYGSDTRTTQTLSSALADLAGQVERDHHVAVEVVTVADTPVDDRMTVLLQAAREAMVNAAKHSGADRVDVYAEVTEDLAEIFVRDRGSGFDLQAVPGDRLGVRRSIIDRMHRHNGHAEIESGPGNGTSIRLAVPLTTTTSAQESP